MSRRRVVVTGMGIVSPVGVGLSAAWDSIRNARSGVAPITRFDCAAFPTRIAAEVKDFDVGKYLSAKEARRYDTFVHYGLAATMDAVADAGLADYGGDKERVGVCIGSGIGGLPLIEETKAAYMAGGWRKITPFFVPGSIVNMVSGLASIHYGYQGPNLAIVSRVLHREPQHRRGGSADRVRRRRRDDRRRHRSDGQRARHRRVLRRARVVHAQRRPGDGEPPVGRGPRRVRARARARASWCSRNTSTRRRAAPGSTASSPATG